MTRKATWLTTSGITGLTLPGMIEEPAWTAGRRISPKPARGPEDSRRRSLQIFDSLTAIALEHAREQDKGAHVRRRLDQVGGEHHRLARGTREFLDGERGVARVGVDAGADRRRAEVDLAEQGRRFPQTVDVLLHRRVKRIELLAKRHRHSVLQLGAADLQHVGEFDRLGLERIGKLLQRL